MPKGAIIVGSGTSGEGFVPPRGTDIIAVNGAVEWLQRADYFFTLDPTPVNIKRLQNYCESVQCYTSIPAVHVTHDPLLKNNVTLLKSVTISHGYLYDDGSPEYWLKRWGSVKGLSEDKNSIHTGNSAYGALGLAYHLGYERVLLIGIDANNEPRVEGGIPNNLSHLPLLFKSALPQIDFKSCGKMAGVPKITLTEGLNWINDDR
jgi:hypothetical protein